MPSCSALNCSVGYHSAKLPAGVTLLRFPLKNEELLKLWLKNLSRANFRPTEYSRLCSLHFSEDDFVTERKDSNLSRAKNDVGKVLVLRRLKPDAVPHFPDLPSYLDSSPALPRSGLASSSAREAAVKKRRIEATTAEREVAAKADSVFSVDELLARLVEIKSSDGRESDMLSHFALEKKGTRLLVLCHSVSTGSIPIPVVSAGVVVEEDLTFSVNFAGKPLAWAHYKEIAPEKLDRVSSVLGCLCGHSPQAHEGGERVGRDLARFGHLRHGPPLLGQSDRPLLQLRPEKVGETNDDRQGIRKSPQNNCQIRWKQEIRSVTVSTVTVLLQILGELLSFYVHACRQGSRGRIFHFAVHLCLVILVENVVPKSSLQITARVPNVDGVLRPATPVQ